MFFSAPVVCDYAGTFEASNRLEVRGRSTSDTTPDPSLDIVETPSASLVVGDRRWLYTLDYSVMALFPDVEIAGPPEVVQSLDAAVAWKSRRVRLGLAEYGQLGEEDAAYVLAAPSLTGAAGGAPPPQGVQALSAPAVLSFGTSRTVLSDEVTLGARWRSTTSVEYDLQGGLDAPSQQTLPVSRGPRADATLTYAATALDSFQTTASALHSDTESGLCSPIIVDVPAGSTCAPSATSGLVTETWLRKLSRRTTVSFGAGASVLQVSLQPDKGVDDLAYPVVVASWQETTTAQEQGKGGGALQRTEAGDAPREGLLRADFAIEPVLDLRTGVLDERAQGTLIGTVPVRATAFSALVGATRTVASTFIAPITSVQGTLEVDQRLSPVVSLGGGVRYAWQEEDPLGTFSGGVIFVQVTVRAPIVRF